VHDTTWFEIQGLPAVFVASEEFVDAAKKQSEALGLPAVRRVFVEHPVQGQTDDEIRAKADAIFDELLETLMRPAEG
jgi:hypothetical protein